MEDYLETIYNYLEAFAQHIHTGNLPRNRIGPLLQRILESVDNTVQYVSYRGNVQYDFQALQAFQDCYKLVQAINDYPEPGLNKINKKRWQKINYLFAHMATGKESGASNATIPTQH